MSRAGRHPLPARLHRARRRRRGGAEPLNLVVEIKGLRDDKDRAKADTMRNVGPAVNNARRFGRWAFLEIPAAPYDAEKQYPRRSDRHAPHIVIPRLGRGIQPGWPGRAGP